MLSSPLKVYIQKSSRYARIAVRNTPNHYPTNDFMTNQPYYCMMYGQTLNLGGEFQFLDDFYIFSFIIYCTVVYTM